MNAETSRHAVLLFRGRSFVSWAIRKQTRTDYSHAALLLGDGRTIIEAWQGLGCGVQIRTLDPNDMDGIDAFKVSGMSPAQWDVAEGFARDHIGDRYDYLGVLRFISRKANFENGKWFCSELVFAAIEHAGVKLLDRVNAGQVAPGHLAWSPLLTPCNISPRS